MTDIDDYLRAKRATLDRVGPERLGQAVDAGALVVDIRPAESRDSEGAMPGAIVVDSNVLLWRLAPSSAHRTVDVAPGQTVIVFCNDGYASSIAACELREVGVEGATDLVGGYRGWKRFQTDPTYTVNDDPTGET
ncbi:MAG: rhodanese-like domain-containing protein [Acidimicrobiia bacterium]